MRLKQLLGLPPTATNSYFVKFWVRPNDLFRPCPDKEINGKNARHVSLQIQILTT